MLGGNQGYQSLNGSGSIEFDMIRLDVNLNADKKSYLIASIYGIPFYREPDGGAPSSNTWFPFGGIANDRFILFLQPDNSLDKKYFHLLGNALYHYTPQQNLTSSFGTITGLLISSCLGGGFWLTANGQTLLQQLKTDYADFYQSWYQVLLAESGEIFTFNQLSEVNAWLCRQASVNNVAQLLPLFQCDLTKLIQMRANYKQPEPVEELDGCCRLC